MENRHTVLLPLVNPDGSNVFGRINAHTVNINRNYPVKWDGQEENPVLNNPGPAPASEPETQHVIRLLQEIGPDYANSIHCCGNMWLTPYGLEGTDPIDLVLSENICDEAFGYAPEVREQCGPIWSVIYPVSGDMADTAYEYRGGGPRRSATR